MRLRLEHHRRTRRQLVVVGWFNFGLTIVVPILGAVVLTTLD
jgi:hypothetical protein